MIDIKRIVKKEKPLLGNYKLPTVLREYEIPEKVPHRALEDVRLINQLISKLTIFDVI